MLTREDIHLELRHDIALVLDPQLKEPLLRAIAKDLTELKFNVDVYKDDSLNWVVLIGLNNEDIMLQAAEKENQLCKWTSLDPKKREKINKKRQEQKSYLDPRI